MCNYDSVFLQSIDVPAPSIWARDTTGRRDRRKVGWRIQLSKSVDAGATWSTVYRSTIHTNWAWDDQPAKFPTRHLTRYPLGVDHSGLYGVIEKMYWYAGDGRTMIGRARHENDNYVMVGFGAASYCIGVVS